jgi:hypothetical protein
MLRRIFPRPRDFGTKNTKPDEIFGKRPGLVLFYLLILNWRFIKTKILNEKKNHQDSQNLKI